MSVRIERKKSNMNIPDRLTGPTKVHVGFPIGNPAVDKAIFNNYGTKGSGKRFGTPRGGGFGGPIPPRPFMDNAIADNRGTVRDILAEQAQLLVTGETTLSEVMENLGIEGVNWIRDAIRATNSPPNSPTTIRIKGSSKPLIDSGKMHGAVSYEVKS